MTEKERMLSGKLYNPFKVNDNIWNTNRQTLEKFNSISLTRHGEGMALLRNIFGKLPEDACIVPPFYCDKGPQIYVGKHFYANTGLIVLDEARVEIGDNVFIAPRVSIFTATHPIDAVIRNMELEVAKGVKIGNDVWIGGNVVINPGVTIGNNVVIGSGSVVTKDIPDNVVAAGNPCRVIREITEKDKEYWQAQYEDYIDDKDITV